MTDFTFVSIDWAAWICAVTLIFWTLPTSLRFIFLSTCTFVFLGIYDLHSCAILIALTLITYLATIQTTPSGKNISLSVVTIISILFIFKFIQSAKEDFSLSDSAIPLGLSYYSLRCIHYIIERYKGTIENQKIESLFFYLFFLPTIWIGPIHRYPDFYKDIRRHRWDPVLFSQGLERILYGYVKVVIIGNIILNAAGHQWILHISSGSEQLYYYLEMVRTGLSLYTLFSGYSDIAIGCGYLLGFKVMENFNSPYFQKNISDFWKSWHISLTSWCREYIYTSVIAKTRSPALGALATLIFIGLWHKISLLYIIWGAYHGFGIIIWQQFQRLKTMLPTIESIYLHRIINSLSILLTLHFVWLSFLMVRQTSIDSFLNILNILLFG